LGGIEALVFVMSVMWVLRVHGGDAPLGPSLGLRPTHPALLVLGVCLGFALHFPAEFVDGLVQRFLPDAGEQNAAEAALLSAGTPARLVLVLVVIACVGPFVEELFFRGALYGALRRSYSLGVTTAIVSLCFVVGHLNAHRWPALALVAVAISYLRAVSGSLLPALALHVSFNAVTVLAFATGAAPLVGAGPPRIEPVPVVLGSLAAFGLILTVRYVALHAAVARRGRAEDAL
ncbi:MAG TPA: CPBP family intramembrane glutamic endopeptidase, partial [Polyangiaceae bacterium]